jgi:hypothetical protein
MRSKLGQLRNPKQTKRRLDLVPDDLDPVNDALLSHRESVHERTTDSNTVGSQAEGLDDVGSSADASVEVDLAPLVLDDFGVELVELKESVQGGR